MMVNFLTIHSMNAFDEWKERVTHGDSWRTIAEKLGTTHPTIKRRLENEPASAVVEVARAYKANPIPGLLAADVLSTEDLKEYSKLATIDDFSDLELAQIVVDRIQRATNSSPLATVTEIPSREESIDDYAADSSPDEPEPGEDGFHDGP